MAFVNEGMILNKLSTWTELHDERAEIRRRFEKKTRLYLKNRKVLDEHIMRGFGLSGGEIQRALTMSEDGLKQILKGLQEAKKWG
jgi:hypothetical protein